MNSESITFTSSGPVLELADGSTVAVTVSSVETEKNQPDHHPKDKMMAYISDPNNGFAIYGEQVDDADAAISFEEV